MERKVFSGQSVSRLKKRIESMKQSTIIQLYAIM